MKRYVFSLHAVLKLRQAELERARLELARAGKALQGAISARDDASQRYQQLAGAQEATCPSQLALELAWAHLAASSLHSAERHVSLAAAETARRHITWSAAEKSLHALERLDERRATEWRAQSAAAERAELDEIAGAAFGRESMELEVEAS